MTEEELCNRCKHPRGFHTLEGCMYMMNKKEYCPCDGWNDKCK